MNSKSRIVNPKPIGGYHGVSIQLDTLRMNIDYEEHKIQLTRGYPRFVDHPCIRQLATQFLETYDQGNGMVIVFPSFESAGYLILDALASFESEQVGIQGQLTKDLYDLQDAQLKHLSLIKPTDRLVKGAYRLITSEPSSTNALHERDRAIIIQKPGNRNHAMLASHDALVLGAKEAAFFVTTNKALYDRIRSLQTNTGLIISSRTAERLLNQTPQQADKPVFYRRLQKKLARLEGCSPDGCFLLPSGMAAIFLTYKMLLTPNRSQIIVLGSSYTDTRSIFLKWPQRRGTDPTIFIQEPDDLDALTSSISERTAGIFFECPSNPLFQVPPIGEITTIAKEHNIPVIVDSTIATPYNLNPFKYNVDVVIHSTTKFLSGRNNHFGGAILVQDQKRINTLSTLTKQLGLAMDETECQVLDHNLNDFEKRMEVINKTTAQVAEFLTSHEKVAQVWYPGLPTNRYYKIAQSYLRAPSGVLSFTVNPSTLQTAEAFYDHVGAPILKGPSLGSVQTLLMAYVILAHYELIINHPRQLQQMGYDPYLFRLSVGCEPLTDLIAALEQGFNAIQ